MTEWSEIVRQHGGVVWKTAFRLLGNGNDAADCFQETFIAALKLADRESVHNWQALLKRIATARALDRLRQRSRESARCSQEVSDSDMPGGYTLPEQAAHQSETSQRLLDAISRLPSQQSEVVCLYYLECQTYNQISSQLGISVSHVGVLLNRAKAKLRQLLPEHRSSASTGSMRQANNAWAIEKH